MSEFFQIHMLTNYGPSNLNRDDLGRPKTAKMGGVDRLRISSQSLKRAWRTSEVFEEELAGNIGIRTKKFGVEIYSTLIEAGYSESLSTKIAVSIAGIFGKNKSKSKDDDFSEVEIEQLSHISPWEIRASKELALEKAANGVSTVSKDDIETVRKGVTAVDIALFGRMLASDPQYDFEAAAQVSHAVTVHRAAIEDDFFTAVDDLNGAEESGSSHIGEAYFGAGLFYQNICINKTLLRNNLGNEELANKAVRALVKACTTVSPKGKQNSFASRSRAVYVLVEKGTQQPRQLTSAFLKPIEEKDYAGAAISRLETLRANMDKVYGKCSDDFRIMNVEKGEGSLQEILEFVGA